MKLHATNTVEYSEEFFTEEMVDWLLSPPVDTETQPPRFGVAAGETDAAEAVDSAWEEVMQDPELAASLSDSGVSKRQVLAQLRTNLDASLTPGIDNKLAGELAVDYQVKEEDGKIVHYVDGEIAIRFPMLMAGARDSSANAEAVLNAIFIIIDCLTIAAAIASINVHVEKRRIAKSLKNPLKRFISTLLNTQNVQMLKQLQQKEKTYTLLIRVLSMARGSCNMRQVVSTFLSSMSKLEKAIAIVQFLASIGLMIGTGGTSYAAKLAQLGAAVAMLLADTAAFVIAVRK